MQNAGADEERLDIFERNILRQIFGPARDKDQWRSRYNKVI
jgi:hypothetical protein